MRLFYIPLLLLAGLALARQSVAASELELKDRAAISDSAEKAFLREDFSQLEDVARSYRAAKSRTASGTWKLTYFYIGILDGIDALIAAKEQEAAFRDVEGRITRWAQQYPDSPSAYIILSSVHISHAWAYRGSGVASTVRPEAWAPYRKYISLARQNLEAHKSVAAADPRWYQTMIMVAMAEGWERDKFDRLLDEAIDREPAYYQTYFQAIDYLMPKWHGEIGEIEEFAQEAVRRTSTQEGRGMYARIYWYASQAHFQNELFTKSFAAWPRMKEGFEDVIARYPDSWNLNNYAKFACLARDKETTRELLKRIQSDPVIEAWDPPSLLQWCSGFVSGDWSSYRATEQASAP